MTIRVLGFLVKAMSGEYKPPDIHKRGIATPESTRPALMVYDLVIACRVHAQCFIRSDFFPSYVGDGVRHEHHDVGLHWQANIIWARASILLTLACRCVFKKSAPSGASLHASRQANGTSVETLRQARVVRIRMNRQALNIVNIPKPCNGTTAQQNHGRVNTCPNHSINSVRVTVGIYA